MKKLLFLSLIIAVSLILSGSVRHQTIPLENTSWEKYFKQAGVEGTFVLMDLSTGSTNVYNKTRSEKRFLPASTLR